MQWMHRNIEAIFASFFFFYLDLFLRLTLPEHMYLGPLMIYFK